MNVKFLNPFIEAAYETLLADAKTEVRRGNLSLKNEAFITDDVTVILSLVGQVEGLVFYSMNEETALALSSSMLGEVLSEFNELAQSGIAEMGNVITGMASVKIADAGFESNISPPALLLGKGSRISTMDFARIIVPLDCSLGRICIHLAIREGHKSGVASGDFMVPNKPI
ncbi:MAG: chemotaxis protein CheX [Anaerolineales bacterium]|nr:chemotaxis protein CheX [Anaerolineales bacterium]